MSKSSLETKMAKVALTTTELTVIAGLLVVIILDGIFFYEWAPSAPLVPLFITVGLIFRLSSVGIGILLDKADKLIGREVKLFLRTVQVMMFAVCYLATLNFFVAAPDNKAREAEVGSDVASTTVTNIDGRIADWKAEIAKLEAQRDQAIERTSGTKDAIADDAVPGISGEDGKRLVEVDVTANEITKTYAAQIKPWQDKIEAARDKKDSAVEQKEEAKHALSTWPVFKWLADRISLTLGFITAFIMLIIVTALELWVTWGAPSLAKIRRPVERRLKEMEIEDQVNAANDDAALRAAQIKADETVAELERNARFAASEAEAKHKIKEAEFKAEQEAQNLLAEANISVKLATARQEAEGLLSSLNPDEPERPNYTPAQLHSKKMNDAKNFKKNSEIPIILVKDLRDVA